ncbi:MAG: hypothetical protein MZU79_02925 [Anaerotruncus sp.]|nr:hypothetical protein [Anaerotruncus sp.]
MFGNVVLEIDKEQVRARVRGRRSTKHKARSSTPTSTDDGLERDRRARTRRSSRRAPASAFPQDPRAAARRAPATPCSGRWMQRRARSPTARMYDIPDDLGTAVNVQTMVFGNMGDELGHRRRLHAQPGHRREGVLRRVPASTPRARTWSPASARRSPIAELEEVMPDGLQASCATITHAPRAALQGHAGLRVHHRGRARSTCCRPATASAPGCAAVAIAVDIVRREAHRRRRRRCCASSPRRSTSCCTRCSTRTSAQEAAGGRPRACRPRPARPSGAVVFTADDAVAWAEQGQEGPARPQGDRARTTSTAWTSRRAS